MSPDCLEPIALIGTGCRFPGSSSSPSKLWRLLSHPRDVARRIPPDRFNVDSFYHENPGHHGTGNVRMSYFLEEDVAGFDASFFNVKPVEANTMDPQHRLLLETVYEAIENAGLDVSKLRGTNTAVYCGVMCGDYENLLLRDVDNLARYHATGIGRSLMSNRISYFFDWKGPSITLDTACSSSLIAVHEAVQVLRSGRSKVAIAAGSNLLLGPENYIAESNLNMLSPDGRSRMWDAHANGYARGEGVAAVVLKTLSQALADGDQIECLIRNTGINQDGRTSGITMPSSESQTELIRSTYREVGLDPFTSRPQYFEAHGTGTPAGDPVEAKAIHDAFFGSQKPDDTTQKLYVGSIKTVIGHTEGTAGLAALLKASLSLQSKKIAPNMLFENLAESVRPYYAHVEIPTSLKEWPSVPSGEPRRASVNSFGFGGANAHAILEAYEPAGAESSDGVADGREPVALPIVLSAKSHSSLRALSASYASYLGENPSISIPDLSWTLLTCRTTHPVRVSYTASSCEDLAKQVNEALASEKMGIDSRDRDNEESSPRILGVFTGQGAQWAGMGRDLITKSPLGSSICDALDSHLARLPDGPEWTLRQELMADEASSRVGEASLSQPLCAAVQIIVVKMLKAAGVEFAAVVGHSSGEIAAAYAAGVISAADAITIAYYRGLHARHARGQAGGKGAMLAVTASYEEAEELVRCHGGRVSVAASNSSSSVTLSGDEEAVSALKSQLDKSGTFARLLKVDKAYHSHHMEPCAKPYLDSLAKQTSSAVGIPKCAWYSSTHRGQLGHEALAATAPGQYWVDNMVQPVLFSQAIEAALEGSGPFDLAVEVGPHPALKTPALQTLGKEGPMYVGTLKRGSDAFSALSGSLGTMWSRFGSAVNLAAYVGAVTGDGKHEICRGLPTYAWDHQRYWHESRRSRNTRTGGGHHHELLGRLCPEVTSHQISWRNFLDPREIPWLDGHQLQGQSVFPAAGYVAMAVEACRVVAQRRGMHLRLVQVEDVAIRQAVTLGGDGGVETLLSLTGLEADDHQLAATFSLFASVGNSDDALVLVADGRVHATMQEAGTEADGPALLRRSVEQEGKLLAHIEESEFYEYLDSLGYGYSGEFRGLVNLERCLGSAQTTLAAAASTESYLVHPAVLDCAFQTAILAFSAPYDGQLWSLHVPTSIKRVVIDANLVTRASNISVSAELDEEDTAPICGDLDLCAAGHAVLQVEQIRCVPFARATEANDTLLFSETTWGVDRPDVARVVFDGQPTQYEHDLAVVAERTCYYYLRLLDAEIPRDHPARTKGPYVGMFEYTRYILDKVAANNHLYVKKEWDSDRWEDIQRICEPYKNTVDIRMAHAAGQNFRNVILGKTTMLEHMRKDGLLDRYYEEALAFPQYNKYIGRAVAQLSHRFPDMDILEVGAGTGSATKTILRDLQGAYSSYTFTDISSGFFPTAVEVFADHLDKMVFRVLDIGRPPKDQGFSEQAYDLIVASFVLHATEKLEETMRNARRLLRPGGYIMMLEVTDNEPIREGSVFGCLPGWWLGRDDGRVYSPCIDVLEWDQLLRRTGFGGVDAATPDVDPLAHPVSLIVSQAVDDRVRCLRDPLGAPGTLRDPLAGRDLLVIGGKTLSTAKLARTITSTLRGRCRRTVTAKSLEDVAPADLSPQTLVLCLADIEHPVFRDLTEERWGSLKRVFEECKTILWVTQGRLSENPHANLSLGFGRTQLLEAVGLHCQFVDLDTVQASASSRLCELLLQLAYSAQWAADGLADGSNLLWTREEEVVVRDDAILVPRLRRSRKLNDRYNSGRRAVSEEVAMSNVTLGLQDGGSLGFSAVADLGVPAGVQVTGDGSKNADLYVDVSLGYSIMKPLKLVAGVAPLFVVAGDLQGDEPGSKVVAVSPILAPTLRLPRSLVVRPSPKPEQGDLQAIAARLVATAILSSLKDGQSLLAYNASPEHAGALSLLAGQRSNLVSFVSAEGTAASTFPNCISIPRHATSKTLRRLLPKNFDFFVDLSCEAQPDALAEQIASSVAGHVATLPPPFRPAPNSATSSSPACHLSRALCEHLGSLLGDAVSSAPTSPPPPSREDDGAIPLTVFQQDADLLRHQPLTLVDWTKSEGKVQVPVLPADRRVCFRGDRTYWLQGLSGSLGLSLCHWMIKKGARHIALSSRNPKTDPQWLQRMKALGANVVVLKCDITSRESVKSTYDQICTQLPRIAGVTQGAMVLDDGVIQNMSHASMMTALRPKVDGSINLEHVLGDTPLDFFVFFSSGAFVTGRMGQANYTAANAFMVSLARRRRSRGLTGSVLHLGPVVGVGYVERIDRTAVREGLVRTGYQFMSESDFHVAFAEAVLASPPGSGHDIEVTTCLRSFAKDDAEKPVWSANPRMGHLRTQRAATSHASAGSSDTSVKAQLLECASRAEVQAVIQEAFVQKLKGSLQLAIDGDSVATRSLDSAGIDSLIAVEIRGWFSQAIGVNVPVLKVLSGVTVQELVAYAIAEMSPAMTPKVAGSAADVGDGNAAGQRPAPSGPASSASSADESSPDSSPPESPALFSAEDTPTDCTPLRTPTPAGSSAEESPEMKPGVEAPLPHSAVITRSEPICYGQSMFWFTQTFLDDKTTLNHAALCRISGPLRVDDLSRAVRAVAQRHESLRTCFIQSDDDGEPMQGIMEESVVSLRVEEIRTEAEAWEAMDGVMAHEYDLGRGELMCIRLLRLAGASETSFLLVGSHHINFDGYSSVVLVKHLQLAYAGLPLPWDILQYPQLGRQQAEDFRRGRWDSKLSFWRSRFGSLPEVLPLLPMARVASRGPLESYRHHRRDVRLDAATCSLIKKTCRRLRCTPFHFYLAVFRLLLARLTGLDGGLCIGVAEANRDREETMDCLGPLMGLLPLLFRPGCGEATGLGELVRDTKETAHEALANGGLPFETLLRELQVPRSRSHSPLFQAFVDYRMGTQETMQLGTSGCEMTMLRLEPGRTAYDLSLDIIDNGNSGSGDCLVSVMAQQSLYDEAAADLLASCYGHLVQELASGPSFPLEQVRHFPAPALARAMELGRGELRDSDWNTSLPERVRSIAKKYPHKTAIKDGYGGVLSYEALEQRITRISDAILQLAPPKGSVMAVYQQPSADWVCSMLAIMSIGAVYVPLDMGTPIARLGQIMQDCKPAVLVVDSQTAHAAETSLVPFLPSATVLVADTIAEQPVFNSTVAAAPAIFHGTSPCAILYTSGSTGVPKGIVLSHGNVANEVEQSASTYGFGPEDVVLQQSALSFDMSLTQIFSAVAYGGTLCMMRLALRGDAVGITAAMVREGVTFTGATPSEYSMWLAYGGADLKTSRWRIAVSGGEPIRPSVLGRFRALGKADLRLFNAYGPTEVTCSAARMELGYLDPHSALYTEQLVAAGVPAPNSFVYIVDHRRPDLEMLPCGVSGEIVVAGAGIASGYLHRDDLTQAKFVPGRYFAETCLARGWPTKHHRTGDRGRWLANGTLLIEGRVADGDTQVKLGGIRIDLCDVEAAITDSGEGRIAEAVVSFRRSSDMCHDDDDDDDDGEAGGFLVAHVVLRAGEEGLDLEHLRTHGLASRLPLRMVPAVIIPLEHLPTTVSAKIDRRAVAELPLPALITHGVEEDSETGASRSLLSPEEAAMLDLWAQAVPGGLISGGDVHFTSSSTDFFHVGGNSMLLIKLQAAIRQAYGVRIPLVELFDHSSLGKMALRVNGTGGDAANTAFDWEAETDVPVEWITQGPSQKKANPARRIVMTGASGFLGVKLLEALVSRRDVDHVYCIAVRNPDKLARATGAARDPKVSVLPGDLTQPRLGLSAADADAIFGAADAVLHNGCDVSHMRSYTSLKPPNFGATRELVRLALPRRTPVHYVSSAEVAIYSGRDVFPPTSAAPFPPPPPSPPYDSRGPHGGGSSADGYTACKWASERFLEKACDLAPGMSAAVYRPTSIVRAADALDIKSILGGGARAGHAGEGEGEGADADAGPPRDLWQELFHFSGRLRAVPTSSVIRGVVNFAGAGAVVDGIVGGLLGSRPSPGPGGVSFMNLCGAAELPLDRWPSLLGDQAGASVASLSLGEWAAKARDAGMNEVLAQFFSHVESMGGLVFPRVVNSG